MYLSVMSSVSETPRRQEEKQKRARAGCIVLWLDRARFCPEACRSKFRRPPGRLGLVVG